MKYRHVLVPLDGSQLSEAALDYAVDLVPPDGLITLMKVIESATVTEREIYTSPPSSVVMTAVTGVTMMPGAVRQTGTRLAWDNAEHYINRLADRLRRSGLTVQTHLEEGKPADCILDAARQLKIDAIVMSTHGRSGISRWVFGSVAQKVVTTAECPIVLIPQRIVHADK
ncbi:MAG: hypothetical protein CL610_12055 [Anaerolineaceae bacterium]|nr:hypothetical protein [Anaerolineaceae bacterium]